MSYSPLLIANTRVGIERDLEPWLLPQDAYPDLEDCYIWRGRIEKRRGFNLLGRLKRNTKTIVSPSGDVILSTQANGAAYANADLLNDANIVIFIGSATTVRSLMANAQIVPKSITITVGAVTFTDTNGDGILIGAPGTNSGTINYITGALTLSFVPALGGLTNVIVNFSYYPMLPVMGLRTAEAATISTTNLIAFDTAFAYQFITPNFQDLSTYKTTGNPLRWTGTNYEFFWTTNYAGAMWATNDVAGLHGFVITAVSAAASAVITFTGGDVFVNGDVIGITNVVSVGATQINGLKGTVTAHGAGTVTVNINTAAGFAYTSGGFLHSLTRSQSGAGDGIRWLDQDLSGWVNFSPPLTSSTNGVTNTFLQSALMIVPYKGRLIALGTKEGSTLAGVRTFAQRARWSENGTPYYVNLVPSNYNGGAVADAWRSDKVGFGGFNDAPTLEEIVSAEFVKDTLVVYFERSTWRLSYTGNELLPFIWEKINTELGAESTFSVVPFDQYSIAVGNVGIHTCDTVNVQRIDQKIPDEVFSIQNVNQGPQRVYGIRDYFKQLVYWTMPYIGSDSEIEQDAGQAITYPNKTLVYNYIDGSFSFFNDSFTCFGYFQRQNDVTWSNNNDTWQESDSFWLTPQNNQLFPDVIAGNQQGFVEIVMQDVLNEESLFIKSLSQTGSILTINSPNHNLETGMFVILTSPSAGLATIIYKVTVPIVGGVSDPDNFTVIDETPIGTYIGDGTITVINNISIVTKRFNPFIQEGMQTTIGYIDFYFKTTSHGQVTIYIYINEDSSTPVNDQKLINTFPESTYTDAPDVTLVNDKLWKRIYIQNTCQLFQIELTMSDEQMVDNDIVQSDIVLHALMPWVGKAGRLINV